MATLSATYDDTMARVTLTAASLPATADVVLFEASVDNIHWRQVRGGAAVPIVSATASLYDYEFAPGAANYYRASAVDIGPPTFVAAGTAATAVGVALAPGLPAGYAEGDLLVVWAGIRNSGTGTVVCPVGYTVMWQYDNVGLFGKRAGGAGTESAPSVGVTGGVTGAAGSDVIAQMAAFRNLELAAVAVAYQLNPSGQNIAYPGLAGFQPGWAAALILGWKQDDWTSVATLTGGTEIGEPVSTAGADAGIVWDYLLMVSALNVVTPAPVLSGAFAVTGGGSAISYGVAVALRSADYVTRSNVGITPGMTRVWLKFPAAPYVNRTAILADWQEISRSSRSEANPIVGKLSPSSVTDLHSPRAVTVSLWAESDAEIAAIDLALSVGNIVLLHIPAGVALASMYGVIGTHTYVRPAHLSHRATFTVPLTEVSAPDLTIAGHEVTWAFLLTTYGSWAEEIAANADWNALLARRGTPADALVGH